MIDTLSSLYFLTRPLYEFTPYALTGPFWDDDIVGFLYLGKEVERDDEGLSELNVGL